MIPILTVNSAETFVFHIRLDDPSELLTTLLLERRNAEVYASLSPRAYSLTFRLGYYHVVRVSDSTSSRTKGKQFSIWYLGEEQDLAKALTSSLPKSYKPAVVLMDIMCSKEAQYVRFITCFGTSMPIMVTELLEALEANQRVKNAT